MQVNSENPIQNTNIITSFKEYRGQENIQKPLVLKLVIKTPTLIKRAFT